MTCQFPWRSTLRALLFCAAAAMLILPPAPSLAQDEPALQSPAAQEGPAAAGATSTDAARPPAAPAETASQPFAAEPPAPEAAGEPEAGNGDGVRAAPSAVPQQAGAQEEPEPQSPAAVEGAGEAAGPPADGAAASSVAGEAAQPAPAPAPSFLDDPAGAVAHLLEQGARDSSLPHDLSPWGMFMAADRVVKAVMIGLALASLGVWTVWAAKTVELACARARAKRGVAVIASASTLSDASHKLSGRGGPAAFMVRSAEDELRRSQVALDHAGNDGVKERLAARLARIEAQAGRRLSRGTGLLATVGSTAPFVGLFGTVWGIMNSFIGISQAQTTNLAVVAPGIAEALLATAIGLVAAIPAVVIYNVFARSIAGYGQLLADAASGVEQLVSLDLDLRRVPGVDRGSPAASLAPAGASAAPASPACAAAAE